MLKTKDERYEALMEFLDEQVHDMIYTMIERVGETVSDTEFSMDDKEIKEFIDEVWVRCFIGERGKK